jgi:hypothetical protein
MSVRGKGLPVKDGRMSARVKGVSVRCAHACTGQGFACETRACV